MTKRSSSMVSLAAAAFAAVAVGGFAAQAYSATLTYNWQAAGGPPTTLNGNYSDAAHWSPSGGPPTSADTAQIGAAGTYTVNFTADAASGRVNVTNGNVTFTLNGHTLTVHSTDPGLTSDYTFFGGSGTTLNLNISNGTIASQRSYVGYGGTSTVTLSGSTTHWNSAQSIEMGTTATGNGTLTVSNGATGSSNGVTLAGNSGGTGKMVVDNGTWSTSGNLMIGSGGNGTVDIVNGGKISGTNNMYIGYSSGANGTLNISGNGSSWISTANGYIGGTSSAAGGTGLADVENGGLLKMNSLTVWSSGTVKLAGGSVTAGNGGTGTLTSTGGKFDISGASNTITGNLNLDGNSTTTVHLAGDSNYGQLSIAGASNTLTFGGTLNVVLDGGYQPSSGDTYDLFNWNKKAGTFSTVTLPNLNPGLTWDQSKLYIDGTIKVVPEPASLGLVAVGGLLAMRRRRAAQK